MIIALHCVEDEYGLEDYVKIDEDWSVRSRTKFFFTYCYSCDSFASAEEKAACLSEVKKDYNEKFAEHPLTDEQILHIVEKISQWGEEWDGTPRQYIEMMEIFGLHPQKIDSPVDIAIELE